LCCRRLAARTVDILVNANKIPIDWDVHGRPWFLCPACDRPRQHLYLDELVSIIYARARPSTSGAVNGSFDWLEQYAADR
jgi:hypothetical protein